MSYLEEKSFFFESKAPGLGPDTFTVVSFSGSEGISRLYEFKITLISKDPEIDFDAVMTHDATLYLNADKGLPVHGIVSNFEQLQEVDGNYIYRAVLSPKLWKLTGYKVSEVYLDMTVPSIIEKVLSEGGLSSLDFEIKTKRGYRTWSYVCQYQETHFNFISRWMEREGMYYYWEQEESGAKLIVTDTSLAHVDLPGDEKKVQYSPPSGLEQGVQKRACTAFLSSRRPVPEKVVVQDFNYRKSPPVITGQATVSPDGQGEVYLYGEHVKNEDEANEYARLRAEKILCRRNAYHAESAAAFLRPGYFFDLERHFRKDFNAKYLLVGLEHEGSQASLLAAGVAASPTDAEKRPFYRNSFQAIKSDVQFRPEIETPKPRFHGTINAKVESEGEGQYAELDEYGRYKVKMPFDRSDLAGQRASRWIRMAQPYCGPDEGLHFPLRKGAEVIITFMDGDPDRPIIAGAVPGAEGQSVINHENSSKNLIRSAGGNVMHFEDMRGKQRVLMSSPTSNSWVRVGYPNDPANPHSVYEGDPIDQFNDSQGSWKLSPSSQVKNAVASMDDNGKSITYRLDKSYDVRRLGASYTVLNVIPRTTLATSGTDAPAAGSEHNIDGGKWKLVSDVNIEDFQTGSVAFYREVTTTLNVQQPVVDQDPGRGIRIRSSDNIWLEAKERYGDYTVRGPDALDKVPPGLQYLWERFNPSKTPQPTKGRYKGNNYKSPFGPTNLKAYTYGKDKDEEQITNPVDTADLESLVQTGRLKIAKGDTFIHQEGNIYDFGGYWVYNLGNSYVENHLDQKAKLNETLSWDLLKKGGPDWEEFSTITEDATKSVFGRSSSNELASWTKWDDDQQKDVPAATHKSSKGWKNIWVEKKFGDAYEYREGNTLSIQKGSSQEIKVSARSIEEKYSSGVKTYYCKSGGGFKDEWKWDKYDGWPMAYSHTNTNVSHSHYHFDYRWDNTIKCSFSFAAGFDFSCKLSLDLAINAYLAAKLAVNVGVAANINLNVCSSLKADIDLFTGLSVPISVSLLAVPFCFKAQIGAAFGFDLDARVGGVGVLEADGSVKFKAIGFQAAKEAAVKATKAEVTMEAIALNFNKVQSAIDNIDLVQIKV